MAEYTPWKLSPFFRKSVEAIPKILTRKFGLPSTGRPQIESTIYYSREAIRRAISQHGDPKNILPFFGVKLTNVMTNPDSAANQKRLKSDGLLLKNDGETCIFFFGRAVRVEADIIFFTNDSNQMLEIIQQIMILGSELHFSLNMGPVSMPVQFSINKDGISIPEMDTSGETIAKFELNFPVVLNTYTGMVVEVPSIKTVKVQGGVVSVDPEKLDSNENYRIARAISYARTGDIDTLEVTDKDIGLAEDIVSP